MELDGIVSGPKKLGRYGVSYFYPVFIAIDVIKQTPVNERDPVTTIWIDSNVAETYNENTLSKKESMSELTDMRG